jgi:uncharacterized lipoprotein YmbA
VSLLPFGMKLIFARERCAVTWLAAGAVWIAASCASSPVTLYTLAPPSNVARPPSLARPTAVIQVRRVSVPDYLDSEDILIRKGDVLIRSTSGRWASRLSLGVTRFLAVCFARRRPDALVTDQVPGGAPDERMEIAIGEFDVTSAGSGVLDASWQIVPVNPGLSVRRGRGRFTANGPVTNDQDVVTLMSGLLQQLASAVDLPRR